MERVTKWAYTNKDNKVCFYIVRVDRADGTKTYYPLSNIKGQWVRKIPKACTQRPLYRLNTIRRGYPVLLTEGEKACDAANKMLGDTYDCLSWSSGSRSWHKTDFSPIKNKKIILWADSDIAGVDCARKLGLHLMKLGAPSYQYVCDKNRDDGWDAYDAMEEHINMKSFIADNLNIVRTQRQIESMPATRTQKDILLKEIGIAPRHQSRHEGIPRKPKVMNALPVQMAKAKPIIDLFNPKKMSVRGSQVKCCCPFPDHQDTTPSFVVDTDKNTYKCYGMCGRYGDAIQFVQDMHDMHFTEAVRYLI